MYKRQRMSLYQVTENLFEKNHEISRADEDDIEDNLIMIYFCMFLQINNLFVTVN